MIDAAKYAKIEGHIDHAVRNETDEQTDYWQNAVKHLASVITFFAEPVLALRSDDQTIGSTHIGNYFSPLELIAE